MKSTLQELWYLWWNCIWKDTKSRICPNISSTFPICCLFSKKIGALKYGTFSFVALHTISSSQVCVMVPNSTIHNRYINLNNGCRKLSKLTYRTFIFLLLKSHSNKPSHSNVLSANHYIILYSFSLSLWKSIISTQIICYFTNDWTTGVHLTNSVSLWLKKENTAFWWQHLRLLRVSQIDRNFWHGWTLWLWVLHTICLKIMGINVRSLSKHLKYVYLHRKHSSYIPTTWSGGPWSYPLLNPPPPRPPENSTSSYYLKINVSKLKAFQTFVKSYINSVTDLYTFIPSKIT